VCGFGGFIDCQALGYTSEAKLTEQRNLCHRALQALNGYIRFVHRQRQGHKEFGDRVLQEPRAEYIIRPAPESTNPEFTNTESTSPE